MLFRSELWQLAPRKLIAAGKAGDKGLLDDPVLAGSFDPGTYEALFYVGDFYRGAGVTRTRKPWQAAHIFTVGISPSFTPWRRPCDLGTR